MKWQLHDTLLHWSSSITKWILFDEGLGQACAVYSDKLANRESLIQTNVAQIDSFALDAQVFDGRVL